MATISMHSEPIPLRSGAKTLLGVLLGLRESDWQEWPDLSEREWMILHFRLDLGYSLDEIGQALGVSRERVRQIEAKTHGKLRGWIGTTMRDRGWTPPRNWTPPRGPAAA